MTIFRRDIQIVMLTMVAVVLFAGAALCPASAQTRYESVYNGHRIIYPGIQHPLARPPSHELLFCRLGSTGTPQSRPAVMKLPGQ